MEDSSSNTCWDSQDFEKEKLNAICNREHVQVEEQLSSVHLTAHTHLRSLRCHCERGFAAGPACVWSGRTRWRQKNHRQFRR